MTLLTAAACAFGIASARAEVLDLAPPAIDYTPHPGLDAAYRFESRYLGGDGRDVDAVAGVRPTLRGSALRPWLRFEGEAELAQSSPSLLASYLEIQPLDEIGLRIGREDTSPSRRDDDRSAQISFPDGDRLADYFWPDHQEGITAFGSLGSDLVDYSAGVYAGAPLPQLPAGAAGYVAEARVTVNPLGGGEDEAPSACALGLRATTAAVAAARETVGGVDLAVQSQRVVLLSEAYWRRTTPAAGAAWTSLGAWGELGVLLLRRALDVAVRVSWANPSTSLPSDRLLQQQIQLAWHARTSRLVVRARYGLSDQQASYSTGRGGMSLPAAPGRIQVWTIQIDFVL